MEIEQLQFLDFIASCYPLDTLPYPALSKLTESLEITYHRQGDEILRIGEQNHHLYIIRSGAVDIRAADGSLKARLGEGDLFGYRSLLRSGDVENQVLAIEDSLLYLIPEKEFHKLIEEHPALADFFHADKNRRIQKGLDQLSEQPETSIASSTAGSLAGPQPLLAPPDTSLRQAAQLMSETQKSALLLTQGGELLGILTDRDFREKVVAAGKDVNAPASEAMTPSPITVDADTSAIDAMLLMLENNIQHLPVLELGKVAGILSAAELLNLQSLNAISLASRVAQAHSRETLVALSQQIPAMMVNLVERGLRAHDVANAVSLIGDAIFKQAVELVTRQLGPAPCAYAFVSYGSLARRDQTAHSDQDNGLILANDFSPDDDHYFSQLASNTSDILNACGYVYCPGDVMARNPKWRQTLDQWKASFGHWIDTPEPKALMYASIFFDMRHMKGDESLSHELADHVRAKAQTQDLFLSHMMHNALKFRPPIGLFRQFVLDNEEDRSNTLNLKKNGITPITDLMRVHALATGTVPINTRERIKQAAATRQLSQSGAEDLLDALEFISTVRLQHQARQIRNGQPPDNHVSPGQLSSLERRHLRDAFEVIKTLQKAGAAKYHSDHF